VPIAKRAKEKILPANNAKRSFAGWHPHAGRQILVDFVCAETGTSKNGTKSKVIILLCQGILKNVNKNPPVNGGVEKTMSKGQAMSASR